MAHQSIAPLHRQIGRVRRRLLAQTLLEVLAWPWSAGLVPAGVLALVLLACFYHPQPSQAARDEGKQPLTSDPKAAAILAQEMKQLKAIPQKPKPGDLPRSAELDRLEEQRDKLS